MSSAARHCAAVLKAYRDFVDVARRSRPVAEREAKLEEARAVIRASAGVTDESEQQALLKKLVARVGFLRVVTPEDRPGTTQARERRVRGARGQGGGGLGPELGPARRGRHHLHAGGARVPQPIAQEAVLWSDAAETTANVVRTRRSPETRARGACHEHL